MVLLGVGTVVCLCHWLEIFERPIVRSAQSNWANVTKETIKTAKIGTVTGPSYWFDNIMATRDIVLISVLVITFFP